jgi:CheY-like chemotaxis protein
MDTAGIQLGREIRERLHILMGLMELVRVQPLSDTQSEYLRQCRANAEVLLAVSNDLLELAQADSPTAAEECNLSQAIGEITSLMGAVAEARRLKFSWSVHPNLPTRVLLDRSLLQDTLRRLIDCAFSLAGEGGIYLFVTAQAAKAITFEIQAPAGACAGELLSRGTAVSSELVPAALSLSIIRDRLPRFCGKLRTGVDDGVATIALTLPYTTSGSPAPPDSEDRALPPALDETLRILVAEDCEESFLVLQAFLSDQGHRLTRAHNGAEALDIVKQGNIDFVIMDVRMPVMDGYMASRLIRQWETQQGLVRLPILLLSADEARRQMQIGASVGCSGYLAKPATKSQVLAALQFYSRPEPIGPIPLGAQ